MCKEVNYEVIRNKEVRWSYIGEKGEILGGRRKSKRGEEGKSGEKRERKKKK